MNFEEWVDEVMSDLPNMEQIVVDYHDKTIEIRNPLHCPPTSDDEFDVMSELRYEECMDDKALDAENIIIEIEDECYRQDLGCEVDYSVDMLKEGVTWISVKVGGNKPRPDPSTVADMVRMWSSIPT